jgi:adenylate kinase
VGEASHLAEPLFVIMLGAPGAGKGTQARMLAHAVGLAHVSSGDIFRVNLKNETPLGNLARTYMDRGELVPDDVTINMVMDRLKQPDCARGAILDGFPRTLAQADALDRALEARGVRVRLAPLLEVSDEAVINRLAGRRVCRDCQAMYHVEFSPPQSAGTSPQSAGTSPQSAGTSPAVEGRCDQCGGELYRRSDDEPETVRNRLFVYYKQTSPLVGYYFAHGVLVNLNGNRQMEEVQAELRAAVREQGIGGDDRP